MGTVLYEKRGPVAIITLNRPEAMNAYDAEAAAGMARCFKEFDEDGGLRVAVFTGAGDKAFCSGADLKKLHGSDFHGGTDELWDDERAMRLGQSIKPKKPVIAAINGYCLAGGLELAQGCDLRIASSTASFGAPEVRWSIIHGYGAMRLVQTVPMAVAMEMLLTGERIDAKRAYEIGLVSRVVEPDKLLPTAIKLAKTIAENGPLAIKITKELAWRGQYEHPDAFMRYVAATLALLHASEDGKEGPLAFAEKRKPVFKDR
ncbi:MAG: enoyl-CoA hydratase/isomerase family protein [Alphaproteobacteria bacterium]|nr:enoyl-CoA hydratase/isomerase family protein [Alphaproteobacteria bacterium]